MPNIEDQEHSQFDPIAVLNRLEQSEAFERQVEIRKFALEKACDVQNMLNDDQHLIKQRIVERALAFEEFLMRPLKSNESQ